MRNRIILNKITYLIVFILLSVWITSCGNKQSFDDFFDKLKSDSVIDSLIQADYLFQLRGDCHYNFELDNTRIAFHFPKNCKPQINFVQDVSNNDIVYIENYNREEMESIILRYIKLMSKINISMFQNYQKSNLMLYFRIDDFVETTLPHYEIKETNENNEEILGVLIYDYKDNFTKLQMFSFIKPVEVAPKWYYYETYFDIDCDCL
ncbi:MAG: hypothetical protein ISS16_04860 [Ignavibacteria bacterium]|nr:hypothetical protein [Ignavibacteria bacterium]